MTQADPNDHGHHHEADHGDPEDHHSCATGAAAHHKPQRPPHPVALEIDWQPAQERVVADVLRKAEGGATRLRFEAPAGGGATGMGLYIAMALGRPVVVVCDSAEPAERWVARFRACAEDLDGIFSGRLAERATLTPPAPDKPLPLLWATHWQVFARQRPRLLQRGSSFVDRLAPTMRTLHQRLGRAEALLIVDRCPATTPYEDEVLAGLLAEAPGCAVLTITSPSAPSTTGLQG